jgi:hypothetical protein
MTGSCRMVDVAAAAAVSVSTVSNVINAPHLVRPETLGRVRAIIDHLGYKRNEQAYLLRQGKNKNPGATQNEDEGTIKTPSSHDEISADLPEVHNHPHRIAQGNDTETELIAWSRIPRGIHIHLVAPESTVIGALVDECMPDGSAIWVWLDEGQGRKLIHRNENFTILAPPEEDD